MTRQPSLYATALTSLFGVCVLLATPTLVTAQVAKSLEKPNWKKLKAGGKKLTHFVPQVGHVKHVTQLSLSQDGKMLASVSGYDDGVVKVWDVERGTLLQTLDGEDHVALSPDGAWVATGPTDGPVTVWSTTDFEKVATLKASGPLVFSPDGKTLVAEHLGDSKTKGIEFGDPQGRLGTWSTSDWSMTGDPIDAHKGALTALSFSSDGKRLVTSGFDGAVKVWNLTSRALASTVVLKQERVAQALALGPEGKDVAISWRDGGVELEFWRVGTSSKTKSVKAHKSRVTGLSWHPQAGVITSASDGTTAVWSPKTYTLSKRFKEAGGAVAISADGNRLAYGTGGLTVSDLQGAAVAKFTGQNSPLYKVAVTKSGHLLGTDLMGRVDAWNIKAGKHVGTLVFPKGGELRLLRDGSHLLRRPYTGNKVEVYKITLGKDKVASTLAYSLTFDDLSSVRSLAMSPDHKSLVVEGESVTNEAKFIWWDLLKGEQMAGTQFASHIHLEGFFDQGNQVLLVSHGSKRGKSKLSLKMWQASNGMIQSLGVPDVPPYSGDIAIGDGAEGSFVAIGDDTNAVKFKGLAKGASPMPEVLKGHKEPVDTIAVSRDHKLVATGSWDGDVRLWQKKGSKDLLHLDQLKYRARSLAFAPDNKHLAIAHESGITMINVKTGQQRVFTLMPSGWLTYDSNGRYACGGSGCKAVQYRTTKGEYVGVDDKGIKKLGGLKAKF